MFSPPTPGGTAAGTPVSSPVVGQWSPPGGTTECPPTQTSAGQGENIVTQSQILRRSERPNKGQSSRYQDYVQNISSCPGVYALDGGSVYRLEDTRNWFQHANEGNVGNLATSSDYHDQENHNYASEFVGNLATSSGYYNQENYNYASEFVGNTNGHYINQLIGVDTTPAHYPVQYRCVDTFPTNKQAQIFYMEACYQ